MNDQEKMKADIQIIYDNKDKLEELFPNDNVFFSSDKTYIGIERKTSNIERKVIFITAEFGNIIF